MKILNVNMSIDPVLGGGTAERTVQMTRALQKKGIESAILTTNQGLDDITLKEYKDIEIYVARIINQRFYIPYLSLSKLKQILLKFDIIHLMNHWNILNAIVFHVANSMSKPYIVTPAGSLQIFGRSRILKNIYNYVIGKKIISNSNGFIAVSANEIPQFVDYGVPKENIMIIPNGINLEDYCIQGDDNFINKYQLRCNKYILFMGRLNKIKGPDLLLYSFCNIMNLYKDFHLVFAGPDGGMLNLLKKIANDNNAADRIHFVGYLGKHDKLNAYCNADIVVIPSRLEAMSIVVLEAGITGTSVLMTDQCGFNAIEENDGGKIVPATIEGIQSGLIKMLSNPDKLIEMGNNLKLFVQKQYLWDTACRSFLELCEAIVIKKSNEKHVK